MIKKVVIITILFLFLAFSSILFSHYYQSYKKKEFLKSMVKNINEDTFYSLDGFNEKVEEIPLNGDTFLLHDYLLNEGFTQESVERGNWTEGPRIWQVVYTRKNLSCTVTKKYYSKEKDQRFYEVEEEISCDTLD